MDINNYDSSVVKETVFIKSADIQPRCVNGSPARRKRNVNISGEKKGKKGAIERKIKRTLARPPFLQP
jgi:hypothetical protein